jgi:hypothetical protein
MSRAQCGSSVMFSSLLRRAHPLLIVGRRL